MGACMSFRPDPAGSRREGLRPPAGRRGGCELARGGDRGGPGGLAEAGAVLGLVGGRVAVDAEVGALHLGQAADHLPLRGEGLGVGRVRVEVDEGHHLGPVGGDGDAARGELDAQLVVVDRLRGREAVEGAAVGGGGDVDGLALDGEVDDVVVEELGQLVAGAVAQDHAIVADGEDQDALGAVGGVEDPTDVAVDVELAVERDQPVHARAVAREQGREVELAVDLHVDRQHAEALAVGAEAGVAREVGDRHGVGVGLDHRVHGEAVEVDAEADVGPVDLLDPDALRLEPVGHAGGEEVQRAVDGVDGAGEDEDGGLAELAQGDLHASR